MSHPVDRFTALAKANLTLMLKLTEAARLGAQESLDAGNKAAHRYSEAARAALARAAGPAPEAPVDASTATTAVLTDMDAVRDHMLSNTHAAFDEWRQAWQDIAAGSASEGLDWLTTALPPWLGQGTTQGESPGAGGGKRDKPGG